MKPGPVSRTTQNHSIPTILTTCVPVFSWHAQTNALNVMLKVYFQVRFHVSPAMWCKFKVVPPTSFFWVKGKKSMKIDPTRLWLFKMFPRVRPQGNTRNQSVLFPCLYPLSLSIHTHVWVSWPFSGPFPRLSTAISALGALIPDTRWTPTQETKLWAEGPKTDFVRMALMY